MNHPSTWVVVANCCKARFFTISKFPKLDEAESLIHMESKLKNQDLTSSEQGRNFQSGGTTRHAYVPETDPKTVEEELFAKQVAHKLTQGKQSNSFSRLFIVASPSFLGHVRKHLDKETQKCIVAEIAKDMLDHKPQDIEKLIAEAQP